MASLKHDTAFVFSLIVVLHILYITKNATIGKPTEAIISAVIASSIYTPHCFPKILPLALLILVPFDAEDKLRTLVRGFAPSFTLF